MPRRSKPSSEPDAQTEAPQAQETAAPEPGPFLAHPSGGFQIVVLDGPEREGRAVTYKSDLAGRLIGRVDHTGVWRPGLDPADLEDLVHHGYVPPSADAWPPPRGAEEGA